jgi:AcrR family transcriptional regulator
MTIAERKARDKQEMRRMILDHAKTLFLKEGFENVTIRKIADSMEYSPATVYLYFKDKDEMLYALHTEGFEKFYAEQQKTLAVKDPWERLKSCGETYLNFALKNPEYYDLMFIMSITGRVISEKEKDWSVGKRSYDVLRSTVKDCIEAGYIPKVDVEAASFALWSLVHGMASLVIRNRSMIPKSQIERALKGALQFALMGIHSGK